MLQITTCLFRFMQEKMIKLYSYVSLLAILASQLWAMYCLAVFYSQVSISK
jgi:hypothetical protein